jgi:hypothetical protein
MIRAFVHFAGDPDNLERTYWFEGGVLTEKEITWATNYINAREIPGIDSFSITSEGAVITRNDENDWVGIGTEFGPVLRDALKRSIQKTTDESDVQVE